MYAEIERLLSQIASESGHDVVRSSAAPGSTSNTQSQRPTKRKQVQTSVHPLDTALTELDGEDAMPPMLELLGTPGSGKTQTLYRICASAALPETIGTGSSTVRLNGHGSHVLFVDVDGKSDVRLLSQSIRGKARENIELGHKGQLVDDKGIMNEAVGSALKRIHMFSPETTQSLVATLAMLPRYAAQQGINTAECVLLVDGLGANFWFDRRSADNSWLRIKRATPMFRLQQLLVDTLQQMRRQMGCLCVVTSVLFLRNSSAEPVLAKSISQESMGSPSQEGSQGSQSMQRPQQQQQQRLIEADRT
ncbi:hypothetical protein J3B02_003477, partial [Coemansia erecta]